MNEGNIISFEVHRKSDCDHRRIGVDESLRHIQCRDCGEEINPIWFLKRCAVDEAKTRYEVGELRKLCDKLEKKTRTKCQHCGKMTRIKP